MELGQSLEDYLEAIYVIRKKEERVRSIDVAAYMNYSKPSVCNAVKSLKKRDMFGQMMDVCF